MTRLASRIIGLAATLILVSIFIYVATQILPADPAAAVLGHDATPERVAALRHEMHLDRPAILRYLDWIGSAVQGNLGQSLTSNVPVTQLVGDRLRNTVLLAVIALVAGVPIALALGTVAAMRRNRRADVAISSSVLIVSAVPEFVMGSLLVLLFAVWLGWLPAVTTEPADAPAASLLSSCWLPAATLTLHWAAYLSRTVRSSMIDALSSEHVRAARLAGLPEREILFHHALPSALPPTIATSALYAGALLGGIVVVEQVFNYPGLGTLMTSAVHGGDLPVIQTVALLGATAWTLINLAADLGIAAMDPRAHG